jgi:hypothetical protein
MSLPVVDPSPVASPGRRIAPIRRASPTVTTAANPDFPMSPVPIAGSPAMPAQTPVRRISPVRRSAMPPSDAVAGSPTRISPVRRSAMPPSDAVAGSPTRISPVRRSAMMGASDAVAGSPTRISPVRRSAMMGASNAVPGSPTRISPVRRSAMMGATDATSPVVASPTRISPMASDMTMSPTRISPTRISPTRISPVTSNMETSATRISPTHISPTRISPTGTSPTRISPVRRSMTSPMHQTERMEERKFYRQNSRLLRSAYRGALLIDVALSEAAIAAAAILAKSGMVEQYAVEYAEHYANDRFWRRVFAMRFPQIFMQSYGDLPMTPVMGLDSKEGRSLASWREYFQLVSGNLHQDQVMVSAGHNKMFHNTVLEQYQVPNAGTQDKLVLDTINSVSACGESANPMHILTYYYTSDSKVKNIRELLMEPMMVHGYGTTITLIQ